MCLGDLRFHLAERLSRHEVEVIWFDVFERKMVDQATAFDVSMSCVELIDRARRENRLIDAIVAICRNHPRIASSIA
jgi:hypothetical protein